MKILYIQSDPKLNGSGKALFNLISSIHKENEIEVFMPNANDELGKRLKDIGVKSIGCPFKLRWYPKLKRTWKLYKNLRPIRDFLLGLFEEYSAKSSLEKEVRRFAPDIIHTNVGPVDIGYKVAQKYGIPHVWHIREYQDLDFGACYFPSAKTFRRLIHSSKTHNIAITKGVFNHFLLDKKKDSVIYDGVIDGTLHPWYSKESPIEGKYFLYVSGSVSENKGATDALLSFCEFAKENKEFKLVYVGLYYQRDLYYQKLQSTISKHNLNNRVLFLGRQKSKDVYNLMYHASAFLMLSKFEGFGFTTVEAMFNRCLVIGRNTAGTKEQFDNGLSLTGHEIGLRVNDNPETVNAMRWISNCMDSQEIEQIKTNAKRTVTELYTFQKYVLNILSVYKQL